MTYFETLQRRARCDRGPWREWAPGLGLIFGFSLAFWVALFHLIAGLAA